jgi:hypothetical protein
VKDRQKELFKSKNKSWRKRNENDIMIEAKRKHGERKSKDN